MSSFTRPSPRLEEAVMGLNDLAQAVNEWAADKGWNETEVSTPEFLMLCVTELSEGMEAYRHDEPHFWRNGDKPDGLGVELADVLVRIFHFCGRNNIDLTHAFAEKMKYNETRPHRHGGLKA